MQRKSIRNFKAYVDTNIVVTSYGEIKKLKRSSATTEVKDNRKSTLNFKVSNPPLIKAITYKHSEDGVFDFATRESNEEFCNIDSKVIISHLGNVVSERSKGKEPQRILNTIIEENFPIQKESGLVHHVANARNGPDIYPKFELNLKPILAEEESGKIISNEKKLTLKDNRSSLKSKEHKKVSVSPEKKVIGFVKHNIPQDEIKLNAIELASPKIPEELNKTKNEDLNPVLKSNGVAKMQSKHGLHEFTESGSHTNRGHEPIDNEKVQKILNFDENSEVFAFKKLFQLDAVSKVGVRQPTVENLLIPPEDQKNLIQKKIEYEVKSFTDLRNYLLENNIKPERLLDSIINNLSQNSMYDNIKEFYFKDGNFVNSKNNSFVSQNSANKKPGDTKDPAIVPEMSQQKRRNLGKKKRGILCFSCF